MSNPDGKTYVIDKPCVIADFDPATGNLRLISYPTDSAICALLLAFINEKLPGKIFSPPKRVIASSGLSIPKIDS